MRIGIIGTGRIGATLAHKLGAAGHHVKIANTRSPASLEALAKQLGATAVAIDGIGHDVGALIVAIPLARIPELKSVLGHSPAELPIADTSNYFPERDGRIEEIESGVPDGVWVERQLGRPVVRAWNAVVAQTLEDGGTPAGTAARLAVPVAGADQADKDIVMRLVNDTGFDPVDAGTTEDSWRMQTGAPAYCTALDAEGLKDALTFSDRDAVHDRREAILKIVGTWDPSAPSFFDDVVMLNRAAAGLGWHDRRE